MDGLNNKVTSLFTINTSRQSYLGGAPKTKHTYTNSNWGDQLTAYNYASITYDASGNPLNYYNDFVFTWTQGRRLQMASRENHPDLPDVSLSFTYNESGIRTTKTVGSVVHEYILDGTKIVAEKWGVNGVTHLVEYIYDANSVIGMIYHNTTMSVDSFEQYVFEKNLQGDIVAVYNASGTLCVKYTYDAWGNVTTSYYNGGASTGAQYNGFRYRGYYYDSETGLYYLNSRYYDPAIGRFINADAFINANGDLTGFNMYAYCSNNPVMYKDPSGAGIGLALGGGYLIYEFLKCLATSVLIAGGVTLSTALVFEGIDVISNTISKADEDEDAAEKEETKDLPPPNYHQEFFPQNPLEFAPKGLRMLHLPGSYNGQIIKWIDPTTKVAIFEWDEDLSYGPHYHVMKPGWNSKHLNDIHLYKAGDPVPEPWNSLYFGD